MSRSKRRTKIFAVTTAESEKRYKVAEHRRERRLVRALLVEDSELPGQKKFGNPWKGDRDGKNYWPGATAREMFK